MRRNEISRRAFLGGAAASAFAFTLVPGHVLGGPGKQAPSEKLSFGCIGIGGKGRGDVSNFAREGHNIVALCDVDDRQGGGTFGRFRKATKYKDFRRMLHREKGLDAVTVSTPDHIHAPASLMAMRLGKHVFCQKPLCHNVAEARLMGKVAEEMKVATVMGIQAHAFEGPRLVCEWVDSGMLGPVREVHYWTNRPIWPQGIDRPTETQPVPAGLDWDLWLGPAPERPYHPKFVKWKRKMVGYLPFHWRAWWDFGCGALGDIACHAMDAAFWALKLGSPSRIEAEISGLSKDTAPKWSTITYQFPARGSMVPVKVVWRDGVGGGNQPPARPKELEKDRRMPGKIGGQLIVGDKATVMAGVYCRSPRIIPEAKMKSIGKPPRKLDRAPGNSHYKEFIRACKGGPKCGANFADFAGPLTEMVLLGNLAVRTGKPIEWDGEKGVCTNVPEANQYLRRDYRKGWEI